MKEVAGVPAPKEVLLPFDLMEFRKNPSRLRTPTGHTGVIVGDNSDIGLLAVHWNYPKNLLWKADQFYMINDPKVLESLRLAAEEVEIRLRIWKGPKGQPLIWANIIAPAVTQQFPENLQSFNGWACEEVVIKASGLNLDPAVAATTMAGLLPESTDMYKVPRGNVFIHWRKVLETNPAATVQLRHMLWFFAGSEEGLNARIHAGELPKPIQPPVPKKFGHRRWLLSEVAKHEDQFKGQSVGT